MGFLDVGTGFGYCHCRLDDHSRVFFNALGHLILWARGSRDFGFKSEIFQHYVGGDGTHRGDSSPRVAGRSGHVEVPDGGAIVSIAWKRSKVAALR